LLLIDISNCIAFNKRHALYLAGKKAELASRHSFDSYAMKQ
jgi:hypothetical protein